MSHPCVERFPRASRDNPLRELGDGMSGPFRRPLRPRPWAIWLVVAAALFLIGASL
jgi:hypothetical protein